MRYYAVLCGVAMYTDSFACALPRLPSIGVWIIFTSTPSITGPAMKASLEPGGPDIHHFIYLSVGLITLCIHNLILLMATEGQTAQTSSQAVWSEKETDAFVDFLLAEKGRGKMGDSGMFKGQTFQAAALHIQNLLVSGSAKMSKTCKTKYTTVIFAFLCLIMLIFFIVKRYLSSDTAISDKIWHE